MIGPRLKGNAQPARQTPGFSYFPRFRQTKALPKTAWRYGFGRANTRAANEMDAGAHKGIARPIDGVVPQRPFASPMSVFMTIAFSPETEQTLPNMARGRQRSGVFRRSVHQSR
jgi:hypothetical protein